MITLIFNTITVTPSQLPPLWDITRWEWSKLEQTSLINLQFWVLPLTSVTPLIPNFLNIVHHIHPRNNCTKFYDLWQLTYSTKFYDPNSLIHVISICCTFLKIKVISLSRAKPMVRKLKSPLPSSAVWCVRWSHTGGAKCLSLCLYVCTVHYRAQFLRYLDFMEGVFQYYLEVLFLVF